jgi:adenylate cyclase
MSRFIEKITNKHKTEEDFWRSILTGVKPGVPLYRMRNFFTVLKGDVRCKLCNIPFDGKWSWLFTRIWSKQSNMSPHFCLRCENLAKRHEGGADVEMTFLFVDVRNSTGLGEKMTPKEFRTLLNRFYNVAADHITENGGWLDKFVGDEAIGVFLPGFVGSNHAFEATNSAIKILKDTGNFEGGDSWIPIGIGVNTGIAHMGVIGNGKANDITPLGDEVNTTARLCSKAKCGEIYISEQTMNSIKKHSEYAKLIKQLDVIQENITVKGKSNSLNVNIAKVK